MFIRATRMDTGRGCGRSPRVRPCTLRLCALWALCVGAAAISLPAPLALGAEPPAPTVGGLAAGEITEDTAVLEARINPGGNETTYELWIACLGAHGVDPPCEPSRVYGEGKVAPPIAEHALSIKVTGLRPGYSYAYWIVVANSYGTAESRHRGFETAPYGACRTGCPYVSEVPEWFERLSEEESAQTLREYEAKHAVELESLHRQEAERQHEIEALAASEAADLSRQREEEARSRAAAGAWLNAETLTVRGGDTAIAKLECLGTASCHGHLRLTAKSPGDSRDGKRNSDVLVGTTSFSIAADEERRIRISLNSTGRRLFRLAHGRFRATLTMIVRAPVPVSRSTAVRLKSPARQ